MKKPVLPNDPLLLIPDDGKLEPLRLVPGRLVYGSPVIRIDVPGRGSVCGTVGQEENGELRARLGIDGFAGTACPGMQGLRVELDAHDCSPELALDLLLHTARAAFPLLIGSGEPGGIEFPVGGVGLPRKPGESDGGLRHSDNSSEKDALGKGTVAQADRVARAYGVPERLIGLDAQRAELARVAPALRQCPCAEKNKMIAPRDDEVSLRRWGVEQAMRMWRGGPQAIAGEDPVSLARRICDFVRGGGEPDGPAKEPASPRDPLSNAYRSAARVCGSEEKP